jgi:hypothetical protein
LLREHPVHHPILEIVHESHENVEGAARVLDNSDLATKSVRAVTGARAFSDYHLLTAAVGHNRSGKLRGVVISAKWRSAFAYTSKVGEAAGNLGLLASFAASLAEAAPEVDRIIGSTEAKVVKGARLAAIGGTAAQRALIGVVPAGLHLASRALEGWSMIAGLAGGKAKSISSKAIGTIRHADTLVQSTFKTVAETQKQADGFWWVIHTVLSPRSKS